MQINQSEDAKINKNIGNIEKMYAIFRKIAYYTAPYSNYTEDERDSHKEQIKQDVFKAYKRKRLPVTTLKYICENPIQWWSVIVKNIEIDGDLKRVAEGAPPPPWNVEYRIVCRHEQQYERDITLTGLTNGSLVEISQLRSITKIPDDIYFIPYDTVLGISRLCWLFEINQRKSIVYPNNPVINKLTQMSGTKDFTELENTIPAPGVQSFLVRHEFGSVSFQDKSKEEIINLFRTADCGKLLVFIFNKYLQTTYDEISFTVKEYAEWIKQYDLQKVKNKIEKLLDGLRPMCLDLDFTNKNGTTAGQGGDIPLFNLIIRPKRNTSKPYIITITDMVGQVMRSYIPSAQALPYEVGELSDRQWELYYELLVYNSIKHANPLLKENIPVRYILDYTGYPAYSSKYWRRQILNALQNDLEKLKDLRLITYTQFPQFDSYNSFINAYLHYGMCDVHRIKELQDKGAIVTQ